MLKNGRGEKTKPVSYWKLNQIYISTKYNFTKL